MITYCLIYIPFILSSYFDFHNYNYQTKKEIIWIWVIILTTFWSLRWECGTDWDNFYSVFQGSFLNNIFTFTRGLSEPVEPGFIFINAIIKAFGGNYTIFLLLFNFAILYCFAKFSLKYTHYPIISFIYIIISLGIIFPNRQALAMGISMYSIPYLLNNKFKKFLAIILIASTLHISILFLLPFYWFNKIKLNIKYTILLYCISFGSGHFLPNIVDFILAYINIPLLTIRLNSYANTVSSIDEDFSSRSIMSLLLSISYIVAFLIKKYNTSPNKLHRYSFNGYLSMELIRNIFMETMRDLMRLELYFRPYAAVLISGLFGDSKNSKYNNVVFVVFSILMFYFFMKTLTGTFTTEYIPYKSIF